MDDEGISDVEFTDSSSEDDDLMPDENKVKNENYLEETVPTYTESDFFTHFRLSKEVTIEIANKYERSRYYCDSIGYYGNISAINQTLIYLWYIGHQTASVRDVADRFNISLSSVSRIIKRVTFFLSNSSPEIIKWPNEAEKCISNQFFTNRGFPMVIGAIDGTHIKIDKPKDDPESYINRKGYYSIQVQVVCDHRMKIIDVFLGYPGSVHDSRVYRQSTLGRTLHEKCGRYFLLGDSGYPLDINLMTPFKNRGNLNRSQQRYNVALSSNRYVIEHCFGVLKQKFRQMYHVKLRNIRLICHFIRAACCLHNIALDDNFPINDPVANHPYIDDEEESEDAAANQETQAIRNHIVETYFT